jgi:hypothetical protein
MWQVSSVKKHLSMFDLRNMKPYNMGLQDICTMCWFHDNKLTFHKALIRSVMTYASLACEFAADTHLLKLQRLQNKVLRTSGNCISLSIFRTFMNIYQNYAGNNQKSYKIIIIIKCTTVQLSIPQL